jgi:hypothetical protein
MKRWADAATFHRRACYERQDNGDRSEVRDLPAPSSSARSVVTFDGSPRSSSPSPALH